MPDGAGSTWPTPHVLRSIDGDPKTLEGRATLRDMQRALTRLAERLDASFGQAVRLLAGVEGRVVVTGLGKSGLVGRKLATLFSEQGTPSFFVHAAEALHGDLGMIRPCDAVVMVSYSGETREVVRLLPHLSARETVTVALVGRLDSPLARLADVALDISVEREACPNNLAPTTSTLTTLAMGYALAASLGAARTRLSHDYASDPPRARSAG